MASFADFADILDKVPGGFVLKSSINSDPNLVISLNNFLSFIEDNSHTPGSTIKMEVIPSYSPHCKDGSIGKLREDYSIITYSIFDSIVDRIKCGTLLSHVLSHNADMRHYAEIPLFFREDRAVYRCSLDKIKFLENYTGPLKYVHHKPKAITEDTSKFDIRDKFDRTIKIGDIVLFSRSTRYVQGKIYISRVTGFVNSTTIEVSTMNMMEGENTQKFKVKNSKEVIIMDDDVSNQITLAMLSN